MGVGVSVHVTGTEKQTSHSLGCDGVRGVFSRLRVHCDCRGLVSVVLKPPKSGSQSQRWRRRSACASVCIHERFVWISFDPTGICAALFHYKAQLPRGGYGCTSVLGFSLVFNFTSEAVLRGPSQRRAPSCASGGGVAATRPRPVPPASLSRPTRPPRGGRTPSGRASAECVFANVPPPPRSDRTRPVPGKHVGSVRAHMFLMTCSF